VIKGNEMLRDVHEGRVVLAFEPPTQESAFISQVSTLPVSGAAAAAVVNRNRETIDKGVEEDWSSTVHISDAKLWVYAGIFVSVFMLQAT
jgi:hypothetical protein